MRWLEISIQTTTELTELTAQLLCDAGASGAVIEDPNDLARYQRSDTSWDLIDPAIFERMTGVFVRAYLSEESDPEAAVKAIEQALEQLRRRSEIDQAMPMTTRWVDDEDWANAWKQYYKPLRIGQRIVIRPSWEEYEPHPQDLVIDMDPGMAFGTGTHETTRLCVELLEEYVDSGQSLLDIGCGSGILSIAAVKLGARSAFSLDLDPVCVRVTGENVTRNGLAERIHARQGDLLRAVEGQYDLVVANIISDVIIALASDVGRFMRPGGVFIASGIVRERCDEVVRALREHGFVIEKTPVDGEWSAIAARLDT